MPWLTIIAVVLLGWLLRDHLALRRRVRLLEGVAPMLNVHKERVAKALALRGPTLVLLVDDQCIGCRDIFRRFCQLPVETRRIVLADSERSLAAFRTLEPEGSVELYGHTQAFAALDNGVHPSLLSLDFRGVVLESTPIGSHAQLDAALASLAISPSAS